MGRAEHAETTALIQAARDILAVEQPTTVRRVVYELFNRKHLTTTDKSAENKVSRILTIARNDGRIPWAWIVDEHRRHERTLTFRDLQSALDLIKERYRKDYWPTQPTMVRIWSEKSTVAGILAPLLREYETPFLALHGNNSTTRVQEACALQRRERRPWVVLYIGDWDPSGCRMSDDDLPKRIQKYGATITIQRVALVQADMTPLRQFSFDVDDKRKAAVAQHGAKVGKRGLDNNRRWFMARYGRACMELDAMNSNDLRQRVEQAIQQHIDWPAWQQMQLIEAAEMGSVTEILGRFHRAG
jgi:hypothetical protein